MQQRCAWGLILLVLLAGCSRTRYRMKADADAYALLHEKTVHAPWYLPGDFDVVPNPASRLFDPTHLDDPLLPDPSPQLYAYSLPQLPDRDPARFVPGGAFIPSGTIPSQWQVVSIRRLPSVRSTSPSSTVVRATHSEVRQAPAQLATFNRPRQPPQPMGPLPPPDGTSSNSETSDSATMPSNSQSSYGTELLLLPIPKEAWEAIPAKCRTRMLEFESVLGEYRDTYDREPDPSELDQSQRLALEDIVDTALLNSREYQSQKESLYSVALRLSLERFDYDLKFSTGGNRTSAFYTHARDAGITVNGLSVPTSVQTDKMLATSADLLARFSNSVVMTFNGPSGFAADVGSDLLLDISQTVFQRDVRFERLTQAERDVIYSARNFRRFRKTLFSDLTTQYYSLLINYRRIEIESQNYFRLVRAFQERAEESRRGFVPLFQVDQVEQNVLSGRSSLITQCNNLERSLDNLKIRMGVPTETPINLDLTELEGLTLRDELAVTGELIGRVRARLESERNTLQPSRVQLLSSSVGLLDRILEVYAQQRKLGLSTPDSKPLELQRLRMRIAAARLEVEEDRLSLKEKQDEEEPNATILLQRARDLIDGLSHLHGRQLEFIAKNSPAQPLEEYLSRNAQLQNERTMLEDEIRQVFDAAGIQQAFNRTSALLIRFEEFAAQLDALSGISQAPITRDESLRQTMDEAQQLLQLSEQIRSGVGGGLIPIEIELDDAMLTGLVKRLDLMTERGRVADRWRQIKLAADDLKSVLNLNASQTVSTRADVNRAFDFTFDESRTSLSATLDLPFNRRSQRNAFRQRLIDYQAALRSRMQLEDSIKLAIRNDLRSLALDKEQYAINVAGAALAYEQVVSTALQLRLGVQGVFSRDFLEAQNVYTSRLSSVASGHIGYILDRMQLFLDLELLEVDDRGFWAELYDENYQPEGYYQLPPEAMPAYGELPHGLMFSKAMRRMLCVPVGVAMIHGPHEDLEEIPAEAETFGLPEPADPTYGEPTPLVPVPPSAGSLPPQGPPPVHVLE